MLASWKCGWIPLATRRLRCSAHPLRSGRNVHLAVSLGQLRALHGRAADVIGGHQVHDVHLVGVDRDGDLVRLGVELGEHVPGVVGEPLGVGAFALRGEGDRAPDLKDHVRDGLAQPAEQLVELGHALGALAVQLTDVDVQHGGPGVVAVDRRLDVLVHGQGQVLGEVGRLPFGAVRCCGDDQLLLRLREEGVVVEVHEFLLVRGGFRRSGCR